MIIVIHVKRTTLIAFHLTTNQEMTITAEGRGINVCVYMYFNLPVPGWLGALSTAVALLLSPVTIALCRRKSTRLTAVLGGLVTALGCLFTSFASQFHQLFFSYGTVIGIQQN